ncbi:MAG TPA: hypothetical protein VMJ32_06765 [Pirellulales bacterium]|nr:hypothetical protein [Pirellulales bacterium]
MNPRPYTIGFLTVVLMVALRVVIGWHFFQEGLAHKNDPHWSSEGFLRQAKGPLAELFKSRAPGFHNWDRLLAVPLAPEPATLPDEGNSAGAAQPAADKPTPEASPIYGDWYRAVIHDWEQYRADFANFYHFSDEQKAGSQSLQKHYEGQLADLLAGNQPDIASYRHELYRNQNMAAKPGADEIPNQIARLAKREQNPVGEPGVSDAVNSSPADWLSDAQALEAAFQRDLLSLRSDDQLKLGPAPQAKTELKQIDSAVTWLLIIGGGLLMIGLFTRLSALALALFLLSVIATQPPWVNGAITTVFNYQSVEFVALLALASSPVGRWAGLDFFIHHLLLRPFRSK